MGANSSALKRQASLRTFEILWQTWAGDMWGILQPPHPPVVRYEKTKGDLTEVVRKLVDCIVDTKGVVTSMARVVRIGRTTSHATEKPLESGCFAVGPPPQLNINFNATRAKQTILVPSWTTISEHKVEPAHSWGQNLSNDTVGLWQKRYGFLPPSPTPTSVFPVTSVIWPYNDVSIQTEGLLCFYSHKLNSNVSFCSRSTPLSQIGPKLHQYSGIGHFSTDHFVDTVGFV